MKKLFFYGDSPTCPSGFGTISRNLLEQLSKDYQIKVLGINYYGGWHPSGLVEKYQIDPAGINSQADVLGSDKLITYFTGGEFDVYLTLLNVDRYSIGRLAQTIPNIRKDKSIKWVHYFPLDCTASDKWARNLQAMDVPVCYNQFSYDKILTEFPYLKGKLKVIPHGINLKDFYPTNENKSELKAKMFGENFKDRWIVLNVNRFVQRKDIPRTLLAFREFKKLIPEAALYVHCGFNQEEMGCIADHAKQTGVAYEDIIFNNPSTYVPIIGYPIETIRTIYQAADVVISTSLGEGWGLSCSEAFACKIPVIMPRNTSFPELIGNGEERGWLADCGTNMSEWVVMPEDNGFWRPLTNIGSMVEKLIKVYNNPEEAKFKAEQAYEWVKKLSWEKVADQWREIL